LSESALPASFQFVAQDEPDTERLGAALGQALVAGSVVALVGPLGAGKTRLVRAIAAARGVDQRNVSSPTFILIQEYEADPPIYHCDTYRLRDEREFLDLGVEELLGGEGIALVEWADRVASALPVDRLAIEIEVAGPTARRFRLEAGGARSASVLAATRRALGTSRSGD
jgi:tRNA threonylcarbamoyladenosine biosynthesis protein TsaE